MMKIKEITEAPVDSYDEVEGCYAAVKFSKETCDQLAKFAKDSGISNRTPRERYHCTLLYSRKPCPNYVPHGQVNIVAEFKEWKVFPQQNGKNALVLVLDCPELEKRHKHLMKKHDATYDYPDYIPHITMSYDIGNITLSDLTPYPHEIEIVEEYSEPLRVYNDGDEES